MKPYNTVRNAISGIPQNAPNHDLEVARRPGKRVHVPWDDNKLVTCLTCVGPIGTGNTHPSGLRAFTPREFASLQSFPLNHEFIGRLPKDILKQIGNSVPPMIAQIILTGVRKHLETRDKAEMEAMAREGRR